MSTRRNLYQSHGVPVSLIGTHRHIDTTSRLTLLRPSSRLLAPRLLAAFSLGKDLYPCRRSSGMSDTLCTAGNSLSDGPFCTYSQRACELLQRSFNLNIILSLHRP